MLHFAEYEARLLAQPSGACIAGPNDMITIVGAALRRLGAPGYHKSRRCVRRSLGVGKRIKRRLRRWIGGGADVAARDWIGSWGQWLIRTDHISGRDPMPASYECHKEPVWNFSALSTLSINTRSNHDSSAPVSDRYSRADIPNTCIRGMRHLKCKEVQKA